MEKIISFDTLLSSGSQNSPISSSLLTSLHSVFALPQGAEFLCMHRPPGAYEARAIVRLADGTLAFNYSRAVGQGPSHSTTVTWVAVSPDPVDDLVKVCGVGEHLVIHTSSRLLYAVWNGTRYDWLGAPPSALQAEFSSVPRELPPYSFSASGYPAVTVSVSVGNDSTADVLNWLAGTSTSCSATTRANITGAVKAAVGEFVRAVRSAGLFLSPVKAAACRELPDGGLWQLSSAVYVSPDSVSASYEPMAPLTARIAAADCSGGTLTMSLQLSRSPFEVAVKSPEISEAFEALVGTVRLLVSSNLSDINTESVSLPVSLSGGARGFQFGRPPVNPDDFAPFPEVKGAEVPDGVPDDIFSIGGRLISLYRRSLSRPMNLVCVSEADSPLVSGVSEIAGGEVMHIAGSLLSATSAAGALPSLLAFCSDGIRSLMPYGNGFRDVRLLSRDVALSPFGFAPLSDATCFVAASGVLKVKGTAVSNLSWPEFMGRPDAACRLISLYGGNLLALYRPGVEGVAVCALRSGEWYAVEGMVDAHHYAWPEPWLSMGGNLYNLYVMSNLNDSSDADSDSAAGNPLPLKSGPLDLGLPFTAKRLEYIEGQWPDGSLWPVKVYGALRPGKWYFLGCGRKGRMRMRGSGWRFFRIETFAASPAALPLFRLLYT